LKTNYPAVSRGKLIVRGYLAAGRPVIVQDTGFDQVISVSEGILTFSDIDEAISAINNVETVYPKHAQTARDIAEQYFDSGRVLINLIDEVVADNADTADGKKRGYFQ